MRPSSLRVRAAVLVSAAARRALPPRVPAELIGAHGVGSMSFGSAEMKADIIDSAGDVSGEYLVRKH